MSGLKDTERSARTFFNRWSARYEDMRIAPWFKYTQDLTIVHLGLAEDSRVLDVGCGTGYAVRRIGEQVPDGRVVGLDIAPGMIQEARRLTPSELADRVEFHEGTSANIPLDDDSFTHVLCTNSFHHYPDPIRALREMRRVLEPGGKVFIFENAPDQSIYTWVWDKVLRLFEKGHVQYYASRQLGTLIQDGGFTNVELLILRNEIRKHGKLFASVQLWRGEKAA